MKKRVLTMIAVLCMLLVGWACCRAFGRHYMIVKKYNPELVKTVWGTADDAYARHLIYGGAVHEMLDEAASGSIGRAMSAYERYEREADCRENEAQLESGRAMMIAAQMCRWGGVSAWSKCSLQAKNYENLLAYAERSIRKYEPYCRMIADLITDEAAYEAHGAAYIELLSAAVDADLEASMSLYQLVYRDLFGYYDMLTDSTVPSRTFDVMDEEDREDLLHLSGDDLWDLYMERLKALWQAEYKLAEYHADIEKGTDETGE